MKESEDLIGKYIFDIKVIEPPTYYRFYGINGWENMYFKDIGNGERIAVFPDRCKCRC